MFLRWKALHKGWLLLIIRCMLAFLCIQAVSVIPLGTLSACRGHFLMSGLSLLHSSVEQVVLTFFPQTKSETGSTSEGFTLFITDNWRDTINPCNDELKRMCVASPLACLLCMPHCVLCSHLHRLLSSTCPPLLCEGFCGTGSLVCQRNSNGQIWQTLKRKVKIQRFYAVIC